MGQSAIARLRPLQGRYGAISAGLVCFYLWVRCASLCERCALRVKNANFLAAHRCAGGGDWRELVPL